MRSRKLTDLRVEGLNWSHRSGGSCIRYVLALHPDEEAVLRALWVNRSRVTWRAKDASEAAELPYSRAWRALIRLQRRGYATQDLLRLWRVRWERVEIPHRAQVLMTEPEGEEWVTPSPWERLIDWVLRHFGGSWEERA